MRGKKGLAGGNRVVRKWGEEGGIIDKVSLSVTLQSQSFSYGSLIWYLSHILQQLNQRFLAKGFPFIF